MNLKNEFGSCSELFSMLIVELIEPL